MPLQLVDRVAQMKALISDDFSAHTLKSLLDGRPTEEKLDILARADVVFGGNYCGLDRGRYYGGRLTTYEVERLTLPWKDIR